MPADGGRATAKANDGECLTLSTDGAGLIGSHLPDLLQKQGYRIRILDNLEPNIHRNGKPARMPAEAAFLRADVRDYSAEAGKPLREQRIVHRAAGNVRPA